ncbi:SDR family NAD(P)-dependent oxidoreductase [Amnibacterium flavum]|uniref:Short-chain dehydrogenase n=1 Tax=Amnibacterium flavum TaxID=2173173 RepID=A0A2V1HYP0_9MICO|nr:SDR family NAD(P)-dependent oxidoreductase [Amnibacterium flavum]PVZ95957.1 short-chain dehydrogenase [Amnibacterium flavum]
MLTALVTGGTSGIGAAYAESLARDRYDLVLVARDAGRLAATAERLRAAHGVRVETIQADLADRDQVEIVVRRLSDPEHPIELFVNNAGFGVHARLTSEDTSEHEHGIDVMIRAVLVLGGAAARSMRSRGRGTIINVSSVAGYITMGSYSAIKAWVASYSEGLAVELRGSGVTVTALTPGWVRTEFHERAGIRTSSIPAPLWIDVERLVDVGLRDARRGKVVSVPTATFTVLLWFCRHLPRSVIRRISGMISSSRRESDGASGSEPSSVEQTGK